MADTIGSEAPTDLIEATTAIISAFTSNNSLPAVEMPGFISAVHGALVTIQSGKVEAPKEPAQEPAVPIKKSVTSDFIICLEDGKRFKSMRRHLASLNMTPEEYRAKWGLPKDYPMVAPVYAAARSELAKKAGLGGQVAARRANAAGVKKSEPQVPVKRGRPPKAA